MKRYFKFLISLTTVLILCLPLLFMTGCNKDDTDDGKITVAVTIVPEAEFVNKVGGDLVNTIILVPAGYSPETYEPIASEMIQFNKADIYFSIGVPSEVSITIPETMPEVALDEKSAEVYTDRFLGSERDPHIWLSPKRVIVMVQAIADELSKVDPINAETYSENAAAYIAELNSVSSQITTLLADVTVRKFVAFHPAYGYFADEYNLEMYALEEEGQEASAQHMREVIDYAVANNIKVIFYQAETDSAQAEAFAEELDGTAIVLAPLAADYTANLLRMANAMDEAME